MGGYGFSVGSRGYDDEDRLVNWQRSDTNLDQSWNLSAVGNWNSMTENTSTQNRTHGPTHEMLTVASQSVTHDAKGNMTLIPAVLRPGSDPLKMKWDFENKLIAADTDNDSTDDIFYKFDALGRRVGRDDGTANVVYFQDGQQTIADYPSGTSAGSPTYTYVYASYIDEPVMRGGSGGLRYYHRNQQYSIIAVTDGGGSVVERYACNAYGNVTIADASGSVVSNSAISNRYTFKGREWDQGLSLYHYRARMYDAVAGRIASWDPIGQSDGPNVYQYVSARPASYADPTGRMRTVPVPNWWKPFLPKDHQNHLQVPYDVWREIDDCFEDFWDWMDALNESYTDGKQICENDYEECICKRIVSELYENCEQLRIDCLGDEWKSYIEDVQSNIEDLQKCTSDALNPLEERARKGCQEPNQLFRDNGS